MPILVIARLTLREASRRRLLIALAVLTLVTAGLSGWGFHKVAEIGGCGGSVCSMETRRLTIAVLLIMLMFMFSFVVAMAGAFVAAPSISSEVDSGQLLAILPRPIRRSDVVLGKWLGLSVLVILYTALAAGLEFLVLDLTTGYVPPHPFLSMAFIASEGVVVVTLALAMSTRIPAMTSGIIVLIIFGMVWMAGVAGAIGAAVHNQAIANAGIISSLLLPTDGLWRGSIYNLEPAALVATAAALGKEASGGNPFIASGPPTTAYIAWSVAWVIGVLGIAAWSFSRREL